MSLPMDTISLHRLAGETIIGVNDWEKHHPQSVIIDLDMAVDAKKAAERDDLNATVDYSKVADDILQLLKDNCFLLIESLAETLASLVIDNYGAPWVRIKVSKPGALNAADAVSVMIERSKT